MTRRPNLEAELPTISKYRLLDAGVDLYAVQAWLDDPATIFDGATGVLDMCLPAEAVHDYLYCTPDVGVTRAEADALFRELMLDCFAHDEQARFGRIQGWFTAWRRWAGVRVFGNPVLGIVKAQAWNPSGKLVWVS